MTFIFSPTARHNRTLVSLSPESHTCNHHAQPAERAQWRHQP
jgi:hypothetical protein